MSKKTPMERIHGRRDILGQEVRRVWLEWASEQDNPKPSWLLPWEELSEADKEVDRRIGERMYRAGLSRTVIATEGRFWALVDVRGEDDCWMWQGGSYSDGYGRFYHGGKTVRASRFAWENINGPMADGMKACHSCDTPGCCNPRHIWLGTYAENNADRAAKGRSASGDRHYSVLHPERVRRGEQHGMAKNTEEQIRAAKARINDGETLNAIARDTGISKYTLSKIKRGLHWRHV